MGREQEHQPNNIIHVARGEPFQIHPDVHALESEAKLEIDKIGKGEIRVGKNRDFPSNPNLDRFNSPLGALTIRFVQEGSGIVMDDDTAPLNIVFEVQELTKAQMDDLSVSMTYEGKVFKATYDYDEEELAENGTTEARYSTWLGENDYAATFDEYPNESILGSYFPQDPEIFNKIQFTINTKK